VAKRFAIAKQEEQGLMNKLKFTEQKKINSFAAFLAPVIIILFLFGYSSIALGVPAAPRDHILEQPDGSRFTARQWAMSGTTAGKLPMDIPSSGIPQHLPGCMPPQRTMAG
jgi:hypothetical protein